MSPIEAAQLLGIAPDATPEQIENAYLALRAKLEDRIAKAPTPGLKAKYRESLDTITQAFETLTLAADSSALPVIKKQSAVSDQPSASSARGETIFQPPASHLPPSTRPKASGGREFLVVAVVAVLVLIGGGWLILKIRADNAEKARVTAAAKAETEHQAELVKQAADAKLLADQQEKEKAAAAAKAEQEHLDKLAADTRVKLAEIRVAWDAYDQKQKLEERKLADLKSDERNLSNQLKGAASVDLLKLRAELAAEEEFSTWLANTLIRHPARVARVQAEELLNAKQIDDAAAAANRAQEELAKLDADIAATEKSMLTLTGSVRIDAKPAKTRWIMTDAYGNSRHGNGPAQLDGIPFGRIRVTFSLPDFDEREAAAVLRRDQPLMVQNEFTVPPATLETIPDGAEIWIDGQTVGVTPATFALPGEGAKTAELRLPGFPTRQVVLSLTDRRSLKQKIDLNDLSFMSVDQLREATLAADHWMHTLPLYRDSVQNFLELEQLQRRTPNILPRSVLEQSYRQSVMTKALFEQRYGPPAAGTSGSEGSDYYHGLTTEQLWQRLRSAFDASREAQKGYLSKDPSRRAEQEEAVAKTWEKLKTAPRPELEKKLSGWEWFLVTQENQAIQARLAAMPKTPAVSDTVKSASESSALATTSVESTSEVVVQPKSDYSALSDTELRQHVRSTLTRLLELPAIKGNPQALQSYDRLESTIDTMPRSTLERFLPSLENALRSVAQSSAGSR